MILKQQRPGFGSISSSGKIIWLKFFSFSVNLVQLTAPNMPEEFLPVYQIQDFNIPFHQKGGFYLKTFEAHLQEHAFIQKPHKHDFYILIFITQGSGTHTIDFQTYPVEANSVFFLSPGQVHAWQLSADTEGFVIFFSSEFYLFGHPQKKLFQFPFFNVLLYKPLLLLSEKGKLEIIDIINLIRKEYESRNWKQEDVLRDFLDILLIKLTRFYQHNYASAINQAGALTELQHLENLIDHYYKAHKPVSFYAEALAQTAKQLNELCKQALGKTTTELIQDRIVLEAQRLLIHSDLTIMQIAAELGYFDNSYFSRFFKKKTGKTPEQFRQEMQ
jgi:AraC-like DNA-binding protein/quercetin dioxygenase-like cupin family protein